MKMSSAKLRPFWHSLGISNSILWIFLSDIVFSCDLDNLVHCSPSFTGLRFLLCFQLVKQTQYKLFKMWSISYVHELEPTGKDATRYNLRYLNAVTSRLKISYSARVLPPLPCWCRNIQRKIDREHDRGHLSIGTIEPIFLIIAGYVCILLHLEINWCKSKHHCRLQIIMSERGHPRWKDEEICE